MKEWSQLTCREVDELDRRLPVLVPLGLMEAHGDHLPNGTDSLTVEYVARKAAAESPCVLCPTLHYGFEGSSFEYPGTLGVSLETLARVLVDLVDALTRQGFRKIVFLSGHGGNERAYHLAVDALARRGVELKCVYHNWWTLAGFKNVHHADAFESETAAAMGIRFERERAANVAVTKSWYTEFSRARRYPHSGGTNGKPTEADVDRGKESVEIVIEAVKRLLQQAYETE